MLSFHEITPSHGVQLHIQHSAALVAAKEAQYANVEEPGATQPLRDEPNDNGEMLKNGALCIHH